MSEDVKITMSPTVGAIAAALAKAQLAIQPAVKDATNPHFKNRYATLASCVEAIRPMHDNGIAVLQPPSLAGPDGVCVATLLVHSSGEWIRGELYMPASKKDAQGFGGALSYARRYCLCATTGLATDDDDGDTAARSPRAPAVPQATPSPLANGSAEHRDFCSRVDAAETVASLNAVANATVLAHKGGRITSAQLDSIKAAVIAKRSLLAGTRLRDARQPGEEG